MYPFWAYTLDGWVSPCGCWEVTQSVSGLWLLVEDSGDATVYPTLWDAMADMD